MPDPENHATFDQSSSPFFEGQTSRIGSEARLSRPDGHREDRGNQCLITSIASRILAYLEQYETFPEARARESEIERKERAVSNGLSNNRGSVAKPGYRASLSRRRSRVRIPSGPPRKSSVIRPGIFLYDRARWSRGGISIMSRTAGATSSKVPAIGGLPDRTSPSIRNSKGPACDRAR